MPHYEEKICPHWYCLVVLAFAFIIFYWPMYLDDRELFRHEAYYAAQAMEMKEHTIPITSAHGVVIQNSYPLFPWLASQCHQHLGMSMEFALRFISVMALAAIAGLVAGASGNVGNIQAATVAAACMMSSNIVLEKAPDGYPDMLMLIFLMSGWLLWFWLGAGRGNWNAAWIVGLFFGGLAFYTNGFVALIYFIVPLIFQRRPLTIWPKLRKPGFIVGLILLLSFVVLWGFPHLMFARTLPFRYMPVETKHFYGYLEHLISFPFDVAFRLLPWTLFAWAPFCAAFFPLDKSPIFSRFLRTIFISLFMILWLSPYTDARDILVLVPPVSIMTGLWYWLIIRRYGFGLARVAKLAPYLLLACGLVIIGFYLVPEEWWLPFVQLSRKITFKNNWNHLLFGTGGGLLAIILGLMVYRYVIRRRIDMSIWMLVMLLAAGPMLFIWCIARPYRAQESGRRDMGIELRQALSSQGVNYEETIYKAAILDLYGECYYMGGKVKKIFSLSELPEEEKTVYLISTSFPEYPRRRWKNLLPAQKTYHGQRICLWQGIRADAKHTP